MSEIIITKDNFENEVLKSDKSVIVDFWASWCGPCKMLAPVISEIARELDSKVRVGKINVDDEGELAVKFGISSIPTVLLFKDGRVEGSSVGFCSKDELLAALGL